MIVQVLSPVHENFPDSLINLKRNIFSDEEWILRFLESQISESEPIFHQKKRNANRIIPILQLVINQVNSLPQ